jgi:cell division GTPase FtsZ
MFMQSLSCLGATTALPTFAFTGGTRPRVSVEPAGQSDQTSIPSPPRIGVIAVGGGGGTILSDLYGKLPHLTSSTAIDIDSDALERVTVDRKILIGDPKRRPRDAGTADILANEARVQITNAVADLDIAFIVAGMGGIAGTAISPIVSEVLQQNHVTTIAALFMPGESEGPYRDHMAFDGMLALSDIANVVFPISNDFPSWNAYQRVLPLGSSTATTTFERLYRSIAESIASPDYLVGFNGQSLERCIAIKGSAAIGYGSASGRNAGDTATRNAIHHPLLGENRLNSASGVWALIEATPELLRIRQVAKISQLIREFLGTRSAVADPVYIYGAIRTKAMEDEFRVTILASGIPSA